MASVSAAEKAKEALDGKNLYRGSNKMKIQFSALAKLDIAQNNNRAKDFTKENAEDESRDSVMH